MIEAGVYERIRDEGPDRRPPSGRPRFASQYARVVTARNEGKLQHELVGLILGQEQHEHRVDKPNERAHREDDGRHVEDSFAGGFQDHVPGRRCADRPPRASRQARAPPRPAGQAWLLRSCRGRPQFHRRRTDLGLTSEDFGLTSDDTAQPRDCASETHLPQVDLRTPPPGGRPRQTKEKPRRGRG